MKSFKIDDVVPNAYGMPVTITGVEAGYYTSAYGGMWIERAGDDGKIILYPYLPDKAKEPAEPDNGAAVATLPKLLTRDDLPPDKKHVETLSGGGEATAEGLGHVNGSGPAGGELSPSSLPRPMSELLAHQFKPQEFLVEGLFAKGHLVILGGRPKSGKSWLTLQLAMCIDTGADFLGRATTKAKVLYYALEDGERRLQARARAIGWRPQNAAVLFSIPHLDNGQGGYGPGAQEIAEYAGDYDLIVIDTLIAAMSGRTDERDNSAMGSLINALAYVAHRTDKAIAIVHHTSKAANADDIFTTYRGASAIRGGYDVGLILERKPGEREAILHAESRDLDIRNMTLRHAENGAGWEFVGDAYELEKIRAGRKVLETMLEHDASGDGLTAKQIAEIRKVSESTIHGQLKRLEEGGYICRIEQPSTQMGKRPDIWQVKAEFINTK